jgi:hypothetical protein
MGEKTARLQKLLRQGYEIEAIDSDEEAIIATLRLGNRIEVLYIGREEAAALFFLEPAA